MSSVLFSTIVAVVEVDVDRQHVPIVDFREFSELDARNQGPLAKIHAQRRDTEVGMDVGYHLGGFLSISCVVVGNGFCNSVVCF